MRALLEPEKSIYHKQECGKWTYGSPDYSDTILFVADRQLSQSTQPHGTEAAFGYTNVERSCFYSELTEGCCLRDSTTKLHHGFTSPRICLTTDEAPAELSQAERSEALAARSAAPREARLDPAEGRIRAKPGIPSFARAANES